MQRCAEVCGSRMNSIGMQEGALCHERQQEKEDGRTANVDDRWAKGAPPDVGWGRSRDGRCRREEMSHNSTVT